MCDIARINARIFQDTHKMKKKKIKKIKLDDGVKLKAAGENFEKWFTSDERHIAFSFTKMPEGEYSIDSIKDKNVHAALLKKIKKLSKMTWKEAKQSERHKAGYEIIEREEIKGKIPKEVTKDVNIIVFRYHALESMAGYRSGKIFHVLFIDWNYTLYNHG